MENKYIRHTDDEWLSIINECRTSGCSDKLLILDAFGIHWGNLEGFDSFVGQGLA